MLHPARLLAAADEAPSQTESGVSATPRVPVAAQSYHQDEPQHLPFILHAKIQAPPIRPSTLTRHRLLDRLPFGGAPRVTLVIADPGFGKTTLLAEFSSRFQGRCFWYRLDDTDRDWITIVNYLIASVRESGLEFGRTTTTLLNPITGAPPSREAVMASLIQEFHKLADEPAALVIDDLHSIDVSPNACEVVTRLLRDAPASISFVLASRRRPQLQLAKWSAMGEVAELSTDDLRFSSQETERLFAEGYGQPLEPDALRELELRARGWAATLQLFHSLIKGRSAHGIRSIVRSLSGATGPIYDYLAEEVLGNMPTRMHEFVVRASVLESILPEYVSVLDCGVHQTRQASSLIDEAETLGIVARASQGSQDRRFHPLLRDFLARKLAERLAPEEVRDLHARVARVAETIDVLAACHHYIEAGDHGTAVKCLGGSVIHTLGSGRSGAAAQLIDRLKGVPTDPAILAIQARRLMEEGDIQAATSLLADIDVSTLPPAVRAVLRHTRLSLGWRRGDNASMFATLREISDDHETPAILRDIAQIFIDASPLSASRASLPSLGRRLIKMAKTQTAAGHDYYAAISLHNAAIAYLNSGRLGESVEVAHRALEAFSRSASALEKYSTYAVLATASFELGRSDAGEEYIRLATETTDELGDVPAEFAYLMAVVGERQRALHFLDRAESLSRGGRSDLLGQITATRARALLAMGSNPASARTMMEHLPLETPLDLGYGLLVRLTVAISYYVEDDLRMAWQLAEEGVRAARVQSNERSVSRYALLAALARQDTAEIRAAISEASSTSELALPELAEAIGSTLHLMTPVPEELSASISRWPRRWLPVLRSQLHRGNAATGHAAAQLLDAHGELEDVGRLRAYAKTYRRRGAAAFGRALARRVSPPLHIEDLGRVMLRIAPRRIELNLTRRKPASLLMYLVTRPNFTATREQVLEDLWPDGDPGAGSNSLNQSLYFIRREIDPWYEDDVSHDYIHFESELLWLDHDLVRVTSASFMSDVMRLSATTVTSASALSLVDRYGGRFCPEFEYEEWAIAWRTRVHAAYLDFAHTAIERFSSQGSLDAARDIARRVLAVDPEAIDMERKLVWLYSRLGSESAARAQYEHLASQMRADGFDPPSLRSLVATPKPT